jgi:hypothetical protein
MPTTATTPTTARAVFALVEPLGAAAEGEDLVFAADLPADLVPAVSILHTGLRALRTGRRWYGCEGATGRGVELDPAAPIPPGITLLSVEGDRCWDRIHPAARLDHPELFATRGRGGVDTPANE